MNLDTGNGLFLSRHFQNAYTTRDIDAAARMFADRHGIRSFHFMRDIPFGPGATIHIGLAWAGDVMIELIQPTGDTENLYSTSLPPEGQLVRFHHLGHLIEQREAWDAVGEEAVEILLDGGAQAHADLRGTGEMTWGRDAGCGACSGRRRAS